MNIIQKPIDRIIRDLALRLMAVVIVGAVFCFIAMPILRNLIQNVGRPVPADNQYKAIQTNQSSGKQ